MSTITTRSGKGSPLTNNEVDSNFTNLNTDKAELSGATFTGEIVANAGIALGDSDKATFGAGDDLQIYHDGSHSYIDDVGTGSLYFRGQGNIQFQNASGTETYARFVNNGTTELYYDNAVKLATTSTGLDVTGIATMDGLTVDGEITGPATNNLTIRSKYSATIDIDSDNNQTDRNFQVIHDGSKLILKAEESGDISFYEDTGTTPKFFWDASAEFLGIGTDTQTVNGESLRLVNGIFLNGGGTKEIPSLGLGDSNSGLFGSTFVAVTTNGQERFRVDTGGNVGIGTDAPTGKLSINGSAAINGFDVGAIIGVGATNASSPYFVLGDQQGVALRGVHTGTFGRKALAFYTSNNTDSGDFDPEERMRIDASGNVGINTSTPNSNLSVHSATGGNAYIDVTRDNATSTALRLGAENGNTVINSVGAVPMAFYTNAAERMRIDSSGNVGIGTSSPDTLLEIVGADPILTIRDTETSGAATNATLRLAESGASDTLNNYWDINHTGNSELRFVSKIGLTTAERMRIDSSGNVGIGTGVSGAVSPILRLGNAGTSGGVVTGTLSLGSYSTAFGSNIVSSSNFSNNSSSYLAFGTTPSGAAGGSQPTERMRIDASGNLLVGTTSVVSGGVINCEFLGGSKNGIDFKNTNTGNSGAFVGFFNSSGNLTGAITQTGVTTTNYGTSSDQRLKDNIADADDAGSKIDSIQVRKYDWKADGSHQDYGMIAQELQLVAPEAVSGDADSEEMMGVDYSKLVPMLIKEIQSLRNRVAQLETGE